MSSVIFLLFPLLFAALGE